MRTSFKVITLTAIAASVMADRAGAMPIGNAETVHAAIEASNAAEKIACWRFGWHGWGLYPHCGPPPPAWAYAPECRDVTIRDHHGAETVVRHIHRCD